MFRYSRPLAYQAVLHVLDRLNRGNEEYGDGPMNILGPRGVAQMVAIKAERLTNLMSRSSSARADSWLDAAGYSVLGMLVDAPFAPGVETTSQPADVSEAPLAPRCYSRVRSVYLAGPTTSADDTKEWREEFAGMMYEDEIVVYSPLHALIRPPKTPETNPIIMEFNRKAIEICDAVVANLMTLGVGTLREVEFARSLGKPVVAITEKDSAAWLHDLILVRTPYEAGKAIVNLSV